MFWHNSKARLFALFRQVLAPLPPTHYENANDANGRCYDRSQPSAAEALGYQECTKTDSKDIEKSAYDLTPLLAYNVGIYYRRLDPPTVVCLPFSHRDNTIGGPGTSGLILPEVGGGRKWTLVNGADRLLSLQHDAGRMDQIVLGEFCRQIVRALPVYCVCPSAPSSQFATHRLILFGHVPSKSNP